MTQTHGDRLRSQFQKLNSMGNISTLSGQEVISTDPISKSHKLVNAYIETDQLSRSLKLGTIKQVIVSGHGNGYYDSNCGHSSRSTNGSNHGHAYYGHGGSMVQSRVAQDQLVTTSVAPSLENAFLGDGLMRNTVERVLK
jgi:hypothetical protein